jgi:hypothetical protein
MEMTESPCTISSKGDNAHTMIEGWLACDTSSVQYVSTLGSERIS